MLCLKPPDPIWSFFPDSIYPEGLAYHTGVLINCMYILGDSQDTEWVPRRLRGHPNILIESWKPVEDAEQVCGQGIGRERAGTSFSTCDSAL